MTTEQDEILEELNYYCEQTRILEDRLAEKREHHDDMMARFAEKLENVQHELALAQGENEAMAKRLVEKDHQLYDVRRMVLDVADRLMAWELHKSEESVEAQLAESQRFIMSIGGMLRDGAQGTVNQARRREELLDMAPTGDM
ncbi:hypothetical protein K438DRAFT_1864292 [Mycena galopus ATCC 62051]|nr:hypothetical protein K438DRAFT_1864292 [Mycena galopus ATCC 62051]